VDESDIGMIRQKQSVRFTVQAYPDDTFTGAVQQVRLQSTTQENVVNYTVVVAVQNPQGKLLPGMTATVEFVTGSAQDVLVVPNAALRFRPTQEMFAALRASGSEARRVASQPREARERRRPADGALLWTLDADGRLGRIRVRTGLSDGQRTQVEGDGIREGLQVIVGVTQSAQASGSSPFQSPMQPGQPRGPGTF
jgi:HlyD family secretion protein